MKRTSLISNRGRMTRVFGFALSDCDKLAVGCDLCEIQCLELARATRRVMSCLLGWEV